MFCFRPRASEALGPGRTYPSFPIRFDYVLEGRRWYGWWMNLLLPACIIACSSGGDPESLFLIFSICVEAMFFMLLLAFALRCCLWVNANAHTP